MSKVILGGGLSGLSAAYYLSKIPKQNITLIEASNRTGGWIKSNLQESGAIFEEGPRTIRPHGEAGANTLKLIEELNLTNQIVPIISSHPAARNRMIYAKKNLHLLPNSVTGLFKKQEPFSKPLILHLLKDLTAKKKSIQDEPIYDFIERRFGAEVADYLISPLICGICAGNAREISVKFLVKGLFDYEQQYGSIAKGMVANVLGKLQKTNLACDLALKAKEEKWSVYSFKNGCETLPLGLKKAIESSSTNVKLNTVCKEILFDNNRVVLFNDQENKIFDHLIASTSSNTLGDLLGKQHPDLAHYLKKLTKLVSVGVVNLQFNEELLPKPAFGLLVAPKERLPILGVIFDSCCFPGTNKGTVLTVMMGGHWFEEHFGTNPQKEILLNVALSQVKKILGISASPNLYKVNLLRNCIPQYIVGHNDNLLKINDYINQHKLPLSLCGSSYYGVGINDVIISAKKAVEKLS